MMRVYDTQSSTAHLLPAERVPLEPEEYRQLRRQVIEQPERFKPIEAIPFERQLAGAEAPDRSPKRANQPPRNLQLALAVLAVQLH
jgi:hypothetical protein